MVIKARDQEGKVGLKVTFVTKKYFHLLENSKILSITISKQSQIVRNENPIKRLRDPPISAMKDIVG